MTPKSCCVLNGADGAWAFATLANQLAKALWVDISTTPRLYNYLLFSEAPDTLPDQARFIPKRSIELAADKRLLAAAFAVYGVPTPQTRLVETWEGVRQFLTLQPEREWCLKYPIACGGFGHRLLTTDTPAPRDWPLPYVVQEFIRLERPEVYRTYAANSTLFGWVARRYPAGAKLSPWVAHARGARYERAGAQPPEAAHAAQTALTAAGLLGSFGCVDLLHHPSGEWLVLEVGTDGMFNHVDRELDDPELEWELQCRIAEAFWARLGQAPWEPGPWHPQPEN